MTQKQGRLIVLEGPDGVGKSTIVEALASHYEQAGIPAETMSFPGRTQGGLGDLVYRLHHDTHSLGVASITSSALQTLHIASHVDSIERTIIPNLLSGKTILLDRYWWSTWVYGTLANVNQTMLRYLIEAELCIWGHIRPTQTILLDRKSPLKSEAREHWEKLRLSYSELAHRETTNYPVAIIQNETPVRETVERIWRIISGTVENLK